MFVSKSCIFQLWIIFYCVFVVKASVILNKRKNATESADIDYNNVSSADYRNDTSGPVIFDLKDWLTEVKPTERKYPNLTIIPILALIVFVWFLSLRVCKWIRDDSKIDERGCSYDVTSYLIITQEDEDFEDIRACDSPFPYDTVMHKNLQSLIDNKMYDTVTSYTSILRQNFLRNVRRSPTPDNISIEQLPASNQLLNKGRFYITPVIDNYVRLKTGTDIRGLDKPKRISTEPCSFESSWNKSPRKKLQPSESYSGLKFKLQKENSNKKDVGLQVKPLRSIATQVEIMDDVFDSKTENSENNINRRYDLIETPSPTVQAYLQCKSLKQLALDQYISNYNSLSNSFDYSSNGNANKMCTNAIVHSDAETLDTNESRRHSLEDMDELASDKVSTDSKCYSLEAMDKSPPDQMSLKSMNSNSNENIFDSCNCSLQANEQVSDKYSDNHVDNFEDGKCENVKECQNNCISTSYLVTNESTEQSCHLKSDNQHNYMDNCVKCLSNLEANVVEQYSKSNGVSIHSKVSALDSSNLEAFLADETSLAKNGKETYNFRSDGPKCLQECQNSTGCCDIQDLPKHNCTSENNGDSNLAFPNQTQSCPCN